mgnify:CR=1 FL=1
MKKNLLFQSIQSLKLGRKFMVAAIVVMSTIAPNVYGNKTVRITFEESDFTYNRDSAGNLVISCSKINSSYPSVGEPAIPIICENIAIEGNQEFVATHFSFSKRLVNQQVTMAKCMDPAPTGSMPDSGGVSGRFDGDGFYPTSICYKSGITDLNGYKLLHYIISPFQYNEATKDLYFIDSVNITIETKAAVNSGSASGNEGMETLPSPNLDILKPIIHNVGDLGVMDSVIVNPPHLNPIDYLIITKQNLVNSFDTLRRWKFEKGLNVAIKTVEDISSGYSGNDLPHKIKKCIYEYFSRNGVRYVLLGGDTDVVPTRYCRITGYKLDPDEDPETNNLPTDKYYACFGGQFDWDANKNQIYGEREDSVNLMEYLFITRMPVKTPTDALYMARKIVDSEKSPIWNGRILLTGVKMLDTDPSTKKSDAEILGRKLYNDYLDGHMPGGNIKFYDTYKDFSIGSYSSVSPSNLFTELGKGYSFVDVMAHGNADSWELENSQHFSSSPYAFRLNSKVNTTVLTTMSCNTNWFDLKNGECLSYALLCNPNSGVVAYYGSSRLGWHTRLFPFDYGMSLSYEAAFFEKLFSPKFENKNFGRIVSLAKMSRMGLVFKNMTGYTERWIHYAVNPMGDPEMPLFTDYPQQFSSATVTIARDNTQYGKFAFNTYIDTGVDGCRVCISSPGTWDHETYDNVRFVTLKGIRYNSIITVTKQNYIPKQMVISNNPVITYAPDAKPGRILSCNAAGGETVSVKLELPQETEDAQLSVAKQENGEMQMFNIDKETEETEAIVDVNMKQNTKPEVYVISLIVDGKIHDSINIMR